MTRRPTVALLVVVCGLVAAGSAPVAGAHIYSDIQFDTRRAPDIRHTGIRDRSDGTIVFSIGLYSTLPELASGESFAVFMDTDRNNATGNLGDDYKITLDGATKSFGLARWVEGAWSSSTPQSSLQGSSYNGVTTIKVNKNDLGATSGFDFWMDASWTHPGWETEHDLAPDSAPATKWEFPLHHLDQPPTEWTGDKIPPDTRIRSGPAARTTARRAVFRFISTEDNSTFRCKLDRGLWRRCASPEVYRSLRRGLHTFRVRARDYAGNVDPTPAVRTWRVV